MKNNSFLSYFIKEEDETFVGIVINLKSAEIFLKSPNGSSPSTYVVFSMKGRRFSFLISRFKNQTKEYHQKEEFKSNL
jgi:hypothetical protein